jgi:hypothetical protein
MRTTATATVVTVREVMRTSSERMLPGGLGRGQTSLFVTEDFLPPPVACSEVRNRIGRGGVQALTVSRSLLTLFGQDTKRVRIGHE